MVGTSDKFDYPVAMPARHVHEPLKAMEPSYFRGPVKGARVWAWRLYKTGDD